MEPVVLELVRGLAKRAEQFVLPALFFPSFFWASKRKKTKVYVDKKWISPILSYFQLPNYQPK